MDFVGCVLRTEIKMIADLAIRSFRFGFCKLFRGVALDRLGLLRLYSVVYDVTRVGHCGHLVGRLLGSVG